MRPRNVPIRYAKWLTGDLDLPKDRAHRREFKKLLRAIARAARHCGEIWHVNSGYRSYDEQAALYAQNMDPKTGRPKPGRPLTAKPGTSNHGRGTAADVAGPDGAAVGIADRRRRALRRYGLCLPVAGEKWHTERGTTWRA